MMTLVRLNEADAIFCGDILLLQTKINRLLFMAHSVVLVVGDWQNDSLKVLLAICHPDLLYDTLTVSLSGCFLCMLLGDIG